MTDPTSIVAAQVDDLRTMQAARQKPLDVLLMECVLGISIGVVIALLVAMFAQGFTLYDGLHVPGLWPSLTAQ